MKRRPYFLVTNAILLAVSTLIGLRILPAPDPAGVALAFWTLFLLPGFLLSRLLLGFSGVTLEGTATAVALGLAVPVAASAAAFAPGIGFGAVAAGLSAVVLVLLLLARRSDEKPVDDGAELVGSFAGRIPGGDRDRPLRILLVVLVFAASAVFFFGSGPIDQSSDGPDHVSFVRRALETGDPFPGDSFYQEGDGIGPDPRKGLWHGAMAVWARQADVDPAVLWRLAPAALAACQLILFLWFARGVTNSIGLSVLAAILLILFYRGEGILWLQKAAFGRNVAQGMLWGAAGSTIAFVAGGNRRRIAAAAAVAAAGCAVHVMFAILVSLLLAGLCIDRFFRKGTERSAARLGMAVAALAAAVAVPAALRLLLTGTRGNEIHSHVQGMLSLGHGLQVLDPAELFSRMHAVFPFVVIGAIVFAKTLGPRGRHSLAGALFWPPTALVLFPPTATLLERWLGYLHYRILYAAPVMCVLAIVLARLLSTLAGGETRGLARRSAALAGLLVFLLVPFRFAARETADAAMRISGASGETLREERIARFLDGRGDDTSVVISDPATSYIVSAWTSHFVAVVEGQHGSPADTAAMTRLRETRDLFSPAVPLGKSAAWLRGTGARFVLLDTRMPADFFRTMPGCGPGAIMEKFGRGGLLEERDAAGGLVLYDVLPEGRPDSLDRLAVRPPARGIACPAGMARTGGKEAGAGIILDGLCAERTVASPGDTLRGCFLWSRGGEVPFGLPVVWHLRLDGPAATGTWFRPWYGKQYRRIVERRAGRLRRVTFSGVVGASGSRPDRWETGGESYLERFALPLPAGLEPGEWTVRVTARRLPYLENRTLADYFRNEDSYHGEAVGTIRIVGGRSGETGG